MDEKRKQSLFRYIAVMFAVAFLLVLVSLVGQTRSIGQLSESSASALERAEELQNNNRELSRELSEAEDALEEALEENEALQAENEALTAELEEKTNEINALQAELETLRQAETTKEGNEQ